MGCEAVGSKEVPEHALLREVLRRCGRHGELCVLMKLEGSLRVDF